MDAFDYQDDDNGRAHACAHMQEPSRNTPRRQKRSILSNGNSGGEPAQACGESAALPRRQRVHRNRYSQVGGLKKPNTRKRLAMWRAGQLDACERPAAGAQAHSGTHPPLVPANADGAASSSSPPSIQERYVAASSAHVPDGAEHALHFEEQRALASSLTPYPSPMADDTDTGLTALLSDDGGVPMEGLMPLVGEGAVPDVGEELALEDNLVFDQLPPPQELRIPSPRDEGDLGRAGSLSPAPNVPLEEMGESPFGDVHVCDRVGDQPNVECNADANVQAAQSAPLPDDAALTTDVAHADKMRSIGGASSATPPRRSRAMAVHQTKRRARRAQPLVAANVANEPTEHHSTARTPACARQLILQCDRERRNALMRIDSQRVSQREAASRKRHWISDSARERRNALTRSDAVYYSVSCEAWSPASTATPTPGGATDASARTTTLRAAGEKFAERNCAHSPRTSAASESVETAPPSAHSTPLSALKTPAADSHPSPKSVALPPTAAQMSERQREQHPGAQVSDPKVMGSLGVDGGRVHECISHAHVRNNQLPPATRQTPNSPVAVAVPHGDEQHLGMAPKRSTSQSHHNDVRIAHTQQQVHMGSKTATSDDGGRETTSSGDDNEAKEGDVVEEVNDCTALSETKHKIANASTKVISLNENGQREDETSHGGLTNEDDKGQEGYLSEGEIAEDGEDEQVGMDDVEEDEKEISDEDDYEEEESEGGEDAEMRQEESSEDEVDDSDYGCNERGKQQVDTSRKQNLVGYSEEDSESDSEQGDASSEDEDDIDLQSPEKRAMEEEEDEDEDEESENGEEKDERTPMIEDSYGGDNSVGGVRAQVNTGEVDSGSSEYKNGILDKWFCDRKKMMYLRKKNEEGRQMLVKMKAQRAEHQRQLDLHIAQTEQQKQQQQPQRKQQVTLPPSISSWQRWQMYQWVEQQKQHRENDAGTSHGVGGGQHPNSASYHTAAPLPHVHAPIEQHPAAAHQSTHPTAHRDMASRKEFGLAAGPVARKHRSLKMSVLTAAPQPDHPPSSAKRRSIPPEPSAQPEHRKKAKRVRSAPIGLSNHQSQSDDQPPALKTSSLPNLPPRVPPTASSAAASSSAAHAAARQQPRAQQHVIPESIRREPQHERQPVRPEPHLERDREQVPVDARANKPVERPPKAIKAKTSILTGAPRVSVQLEKPPSPRRPSAPAPAAEPNRKNKPKQSVIPGATRATPDDASMPQQTKTQMVSAMRTAIEQATAPARKTVTFAEGATEIPTQSACTDTATSDGDDHVGNTNGATAARRSGEKQHVLKRNRSAGSTGAALGDRPKRSAKDVRLLMDDLQYSLDMLFGRHKSPDKMELVAALTKMLDLLMPETMAAEKGEAGQAQSQTMVPVVRGKSPLLEHLKKSPGQVRTIVDGLLEFRKRVAPIPLLVMGVLMMIVDGATECFARQHVEPLVEAFYGSCFDSKEENAVPNHEKESKRLYKRYGRVGKRAESAEEVNKKALTDVRNALHTNSLLLTNGLSLKLFTNCTQVASLLSGVVLAKVLSTHPNNRAAVLNQNRLGRVCAVLYRALTAIKVLDKRKENEEIRKEKDKRMVLLGVTIMVFEASSVSDEVKKKIVMESTVLQKTLHYMRYLTLHGELHNQVVECFAVNSIRLWINLVHSHNRGLRIFRAKQQFEEDGDVNWVGAEVAVDCLAAAVVMEYGAPGPAPGRWKFDIAVLCLALLVSVVDECPQIRNNFPAVRPTRTKNRNAGGVAFVLELLKLAWADPEHQEPQEYLMERKVITGYLCLLLGALVRQSPANCAVIRKALPGHTLDGLPPVIHDFLDFHHSAGVNQNELNQMYKRIVDGLLIEEAIMKKIDRGEDVSGLLPVMDQ